MRLNMHPDGGIARFRVFGTAVPVFPEDPEAVLDLAFVGNGGHAVSCSDQHFGTKDNLLLPGRGKDMGDGWETSRSRVEGHVDWVVVKLVCGPADMGGWDDWLTVVVGRAGSGESDCGGYVTL